MRINRLKLATASFLLCFIFPLLSACDKGSDGVKFSRKPRQREHRPRRDNSTRPPQLFIVFEEPMARSDLPEPLSMDETLDYVTCKEPSRRTPRHRIELQTSTFVFRNRTIKVTPVSDPDVKTDNPLLPIRRISSLISGMMPILLQNPHSIWMLIFRV